MSDSNTPEGLEKSTQLEDNGEGSENHAECSATDEPGEALDSTKHVQLVETLNWLSDNYERSDGICVPRCVLYTHYLDFCKKHDFSPSSAATFGKIIRQKFPKLTTRRLGTRGQSKYHYYGIGIKRSSIYYHSVYSGPGLTRFSEKKPKMEGSNKKFSLSSKTGTLLPEYPDAHNLVLPPEVPCEKVEIFILMYRTHSQRLLDVIVSNNFDEVQNFLLHFWQGLPPHLSCLLNYDVIIDVVVLCDSILYKVLNDVLIPTVIQDIPESLQNEIRLFARKLPVWLEMSLDQIPGEVRKKKMKVVRTFVQSLRRQMSFIHLAQTARSVLLSHESITEMLGDLKEITSITSFYHAGLTEELKASSKEMLAEFEALMKKQAPLESFIEWIDCVIDDRLLKTHDDSDIDPSQFNSQASEFLMNWSFITGKLMAEFTMRALKSFGKFHLLNLMLQEYALLTIETQHEKAVHIGYQRNVQQHMKKTAIIKTKAMVRTSNRKAGSAQPNKAKKRRASTCANTQDDLDPDLLKNKQLNSHGSCLNHTESTRDASGMSSEDSRHQVGGNPSQSYPPAYTQNTEATAPTSNHVPLHQNIPGHNYYSDTNGGQPERSYNIPYQNQRPTPEYGHQSVSIPVGSFSYPQTTFPNPVVPPHLPLPTSWNNSSTATGFGVYTDSPGHTAPVHYGNMMHFSTPEQSRDYRNFNTPGFQPLVDDRTGRYAPSGMMIPNNMNRFEPVDGVARNLPFPSDFPPMPNH
ncbi:DNA-binding protein RFX6-like [Lytechinus variegatus]|uniref:DNA-binding protein RFX6-like n=1 Tax=Lytechinus variegatus TaxID=7654 RepID=UPI001BB1AC81|nr:DNA-binding protein RFX6-like [Lytechinus variegatus]